MRKSSSYGNALATQAMSLALVAGVCVALIGMLNVVGTVGGGGQAEGRCWLHEL